MAVNWLISLLFFFFVFLNIRVIHSNSQFIHILKMSSSKENELLYTAVDFKSVVKQSFQKAGKSC